MASKLCCAAEQEGREGSPDLPNARITAPTPPSQPLLFAGSPNSQFTSARSEDLLELRHIFDNNTNKSGSPKAPRICSNRPSIYSLHSLHKMTSMRSILKRKFFKETSKNFSDLSAGRPAIKEESGTMLKHHQADPQRQLKVTKDDLRRDLLSDKKPAEGGYDSDAEALDDVAHNVGKKTPSKRPSIHSVDWTPSTGSKSTPGSLLCHNSTELKQDSQPYQIQSPQALDLSTRLTQVFSTPNLRAEVPSERDRKLRPSHSATSMGLPKPSPLSPLRLPSLNSHDQNGVPWSEVMSESLRLSQFPIPPRHTSLKPSKTSLAPEPINTTEHVRGDKTDSITTISRMSSPKRAIEIRVQQPTFVATPRPSASIRRNTHENADPIADTHTEAVHDDPEESDHRCSVHLYSMRISHHLRSGSMLSWDELADASDLPAPPRLFRQRTVSDQSRSFKIHDQLARHERLSSSSGFASGKVPSRWGKVLPNDHDLRADVASSVNSSRPQSPPDSNFGSMTVVSKDGGVYQDLYQSSVDLQKPRRSSSFPTDNEDTPRPLQRYGVTNSAVAHEVSPRTSLLAPSTQLARKNGVADTKKSKFREEFSPSPPRKKLAPSTSIMKFLNHKRLSLRSLSEANLRSDTSTAALDGPCDTLPIPTDRERRQSRSLISLQTEQDALRKNKEIDQVWDKALKAYQEEKASMFLPKNKELAVQASPLRERSGSASGRRPSAQDDREPNAVLTFSKRFSAPVLQLPVFGQTPSMQSPELTRRSATAGREPLTPSQEVAEAFDKQGDSADVVGAWGSYPSHSRTERTLLLGKKDRVESRDFALETTVRFASVRDEDDDEDLVGPKEQLPTTPLRPGEKKRKKRFGTGKMSKSHSMTFGRKLMQNYYVGIFKSSSTEFRQHGRGHRSSIASGGTLKHPELELLPEVFMSNPTDGAGDVPSNHSDKQVMRRHSERRSDYKGKGKLPISDSTATLRPRRNSSAPNLQDHISSNDGAGDSENGQGRARVWSNYYETLVSSFPRLSSDSDVALGDLRGPSHVSFDNKRVSMHPHSVPSRHSRHSRNMSQLSHLSGFSRGGTDDGAAEACSIVSVRRSTMDLISKFKEQENLEHERVLSLTRAECRREVDRLAAL
ncbi:hypothetical protein DE146DRAFT_173047 [Phaeosphaeria sp. MPI-PUGE-AT-0046c]|nr:hypothetical protein DE146DRAFT_173047 [Phaeosphaeria sp. MPI-PUGE-AT-0046c]